MTTIPFYIRLNTNKALEKSDVRAWFQTVKRTLLDGLLGSIQVTNPQGQPDKIFLIHKTLKTGKHVYDIPLVRNLTDNEANQVKEAYKAINPPGDYEIELSSLDIETPRQGPADAVVVDEDDYNRMCETLAKHHHQRWYDERIAHGWTYGLNFNNKTKNHPMLRPWEELPEQYRKVDYELPQKFMNLLAEFGYVVVRQDDLNKWLKK